jgi:hypothetical protein
MINRSSTTKTILLLLTEVLNATNLLLILKKKDYLIRVKDINSSGILSKLHLPTTEEFDTSIKRILAKKQSKEVLARPEVSEIYRF